MSTRLLDPSGTQAGVLAPPPTEPKATRTSAPPVVFVCCVEGGRLEEETIRLASSLRSNGGGFADCPLLAFSPRRDLPLCGSTVASFKRLNVTHVTERTNRKYAWYGYMNKLHALLSAERLAPDAVIVWLDSDIVVLDEPTAFVLDDSFDIGACTGSRHGGTTGPDDPEDGCWRALCETLGLSLDALPWVDCALDRERVRFYFNSGVFAYRAEARFGQHFFDSVRHQLERRVASPTLGVTLIEQAAFGLAILRAGMRYRIWPDLYNFHIVPFLHQYHDGQRFRNAKLLHYHRSMAPEHWPAFMELVKRDHPSLHSWLAPRGPVDHRYDGPLWARALRKPLTVSRAVRRRWYERCASHG